MIRLVQLGIEHPHAAAYRETLWLLRDRIQVVGFLRDAERAPEPVAAPFEAVPIFTSLDDLLAAVRFDAAQVMLPNHLMVGVLTRLAEAGVHLWAEKPVARRAADLAPVAAAARRTGIVFAAGYQSRFYPTTRAVRRLVAEGLLGPLTFAQMTTATTTIKRRDPNGPLGYLVDNAISGGGVWHWLGCHMLDLLLAITAARPTNISAMTATAGETAVEVEDVAAVTLQFETRWLASLSYGYLLPTTEPCPFGDDTPEPGLYGQRGWVRWNSARDTLRAFSQDRRWADSPWRQETFATPPTPGYGRAAKLAMENFCDAIAGLAAPAYRIEQAVLVLQLIEIAYESARTGTALTVRGPSPAPSSPDRVRAIGSVNDELGRIG